MNPLSYKFYLILTLITYFQVSAQGTSSFVLQSPICIGEQVDIVNTSINSVRQEWDFCLGDFQNPTPVSSSTSVPNLNLGYGYKLVEDNGVFYSFIVSRTNSSLLRVFHGADPLNIDSIQNLGNLGILSNPEGIDILDFNGNWHAIIGSLNVGANITRIDFPDGLGEDLQVSDLGNFDFTSDRKRDVKLAKEGDSLILVFSAYNSNRLIRINYRESFDNSISSGDTYISSIPGLSLITGFDIKKIEEDFIVHAISRDNQNLVRLNFGESLTNNAVLDQTYVLPEISQSIRLKLFQEGSEFYGFVGSESVSTFTYNFGDLTVVQQPSLVSHDELLDGLIDLSVISDDGSFKLGGVKSSTLFFVDFTVSCGENVAWSLDLEPRNVIYNSDGGKDIWLQSFDVNGNTSSAVETLTVLPQTAPTISHTSQEVCISNPISFSPSTPGLTSYDWDFDGDGMVDISDPTGSDQSFDYSGLGTGTYTVRLDVNDGTCDNFYEEEIIIYPAPPVPTFMASASEECTNTDITFTNTTDESQHVGIMLYKWDFDNDGVIDSTDPNPTFAYSTAGVKTVVLTDSIPGCSATSTPFNITINPGPTAAFFAPSVCQDEAMQFTNTSENAISYFWDFGDGFTSTNENPSHVFAAGGNYFVTLTATDSEGCDASEIIEVAVSDIPVVNFDYNVPCNSSSGVTFNDMSTVNGATIVSWSWSVDGEEVSTDQNPSITFDDTGTSTISLVVGSSNGCQSSFDEDIEILAAPQPDFNSVIACQGETSTFEDMTISSGNPIVSWLWDVNGTPYTTEDITHVFSDPGMYDVTLEVTAQNFCTESITRTIEVLQLPSVDFSLEGDCDNELINTTDQTQEFDDPVISRRWMLDGQSVGNGGQLFLESLDEGDYELMLEVETASGCIVSSTESISINDAPSASFEFDRFYGIPGDQLTFTNTTSGGSSFQWLQNGEFVSSEQTTQLFEFTQAGTYNVALVAENDLNCSDTVTQQVIIAIPEVDLRIGSFDLVEEGTVGKIFLEIENQSNLPVDLTQVQVELENQFSVTEEINQLLEIGQTQLVGLNVGIPLEVSQPTYFCVTVTSQYSIGSGDLTYPDLTPTDNEKCLTLEPNIVVEDPFPNPLTANQFQMKVVLPQEETVLVKLINSAGKLERAKSFEAASGLNNFFVEMTTLRPGIYFVTVQVGDKIFKRKLLKL